MWENTARQQTRRKAVKKKENTVEVPFPQTLFLTLKMY